MAASVGKLIQILVVNTLIGLGIDVVDVGLSTTPTVEMACGLGKEQARWDYYHGQS
jgi:hypothetical protein